MSFDFHFYPRFMYVYTHRGTYTTADLNWFKSKRCGCLRFKRKLCHEVSAQHYWHNAILAKDNSRLKKTNSSMNSYSQRIKQYYCASVCELSIKENVLYE